MSGSNPSAAEWVAQVPVDIGFVMGTSAWRNHTYSCGIAMLAACEGNVFFFVCKVHSEHSPYSGSFFKVDLLLESHFPLSKLDPRADQFNHVRSFVEGKYGGTEWFT